MGSMTFLPDPSSPPFPRRERQRGKRMAPLTTAAMPNLRMDNVDMDWLYGVKPGDFLVLDNAQGDYPDPPAVVGMEQEWYLITEDGDFLAVNNPDTKSWILKTHPNPDMLRSSE